MKKQLLALAVVPALAVAAVVLLDATPAAAPVAPISARAPESPAQMLAVHDAFTRKSGVVPPGAFRRAVEQKLAMAHLKAEVSGANGTWQEYGTGGLLNGGGHQNVSNRADTFAYDPVNQRLFVALGSGGVWMSEARNGDPATLADRWVAIDGALPSTIFSAVGWTPAGGGTVVVAGGEHMMGSGTRFGLGAFWSDDLGATWNQSAGVPDEALAYTVAVDQAHPDVVYAATSKGLFRSADAGRNFVNVRLPTVNGDTDCAGVEDVSSPCQYTNFVTDVVVQAPGGKTSVVCAEAGCPVLAAVGFRAGAGASFKDGRSQAPSNGIYKSDTGEAGTFARADIAAVATASNDGFALQQRIGRIEMGVAEGPDQDHNYVYAMVQDAVLFNDGPQTIDAPDVFPLPAGPPLVPYATLFNGLYVSNDFGVHWVKAASTEEIANNTQSGTALGLNALLGYAPGIQSWYNLWIKPDPTRQDDRGVPTRLAFGLEEVWQNKTANEPQDGPTQSGTDDYRVLGGYGAPTHADQQGGIFIPTGDGGVCLIIGNDGGVAKQCVESGAELNRAKWGRDAFNEGIYAMLPYGFAVAKDGTVWFGLQDNGSGHIEPDSRLMIANLGGDGFYCETDPDNSDVAYCESQNAGMNVTTNRGGAWADFKPATLVAQTGVEFDQWFSMDPTDANHLITGGLLIYETILGPETAPEDWVTVFNLGLNPATNEQRRQTASDIEGAPAYVGWCGPCGSWAETTAFQNGIATNVGGDAEPQKANSAGWHIAAAQGLANRYITSVEIDPADVNTVYVTVAGYYSAIRNPQGYLEDNPNIGTGNVFKSTDAGETFHDVSGNLPRVAVNSVMLRNGQLLASTEVGPFISSDAEGTEWAPLGNGLPNVPVTRMRLRPGDPNELFASTFGRMIWTYRFEGDAEMKPGVAQPAAFGASGAFGWLALAGLAGMALLRRGIRFK